jgi:pSer/pThr/pTyr-binding forkhead associated (FHA) protein
MTDFLERRSCMKICANCGWENDDDFNFCLGCGTPLPSKEEAARAASTPPPAPEPVPAPEPAPAPVVVAPEPSRPVEKSTEAIVDVAQHLEEFARTRQQEQTSSREEPTIPVQTKQPEPVVEEEEITALASMDMLEEVGDDPNPLTSSDMLEEVEEPTQTRVSSPEPASIAPPGPLLGGATLRDGQIPTQESPAPEPTIPAPAPEPLVSAATEEMKTCPSCGIVNPSDNAFCGSCGTNLRNVPVDGEAPAPQPTAAPPATAPASVPAPASVVEAPAPSPASLVLLLPNGQEGGRYPLKAEKTILGRKQGNILFLDDPYISPSHATFEEGSDGILALKDNQSLNGLFLRLKQRVELTSGDVILMGKQLLRFETLQRSTHKSTIEESSQSSPQTPPTWGSPWGPYWGRLVQIIEGGYEGNAVLLGGHQMELGRERGHITFPNDRFISGIHARILSSNGRFYMEDVGSRNGTFIRIRQEHQVQHEDVLIIGEQLMRVELNA